MSAWCCESCGRWFDSECSSHSRDEHHPKCDGSCHLGLCPVEVECGPVTLRSEDTRPEPNDVDVENAILHAWQAWATARGLSAAADTTEEAIRHYSELWYTFRDGFHEGYALAQAQSQAHKEITDGK